MDTFVFEYFNYLLFLALAILFVAWVHAVRSALPQRAIRIATTKSLSLTSDYGVFYADLGDYIARDLATIQLSKNPDDNKNRWKSIDNEYQLKPDFSNTYSRAGIIDKAICAN